MTKSETAVLIFDGDCGFCTTTANYIKRKTSTPLEVHAWQLVDLSIYGLTKAEASSKVQFVLDGRVFAGHTAFAMLLKIQNSWLLKLLGRVLLVPPMSWLSRLGYFLVAKYRHKLPGGTPACELPKTTR